MKKIVLLAFVLVLLSTAVFVRFVRPVVADGTIYIMADGSIVGTTDISSADNITYTFTDNINDSIVVEKHNIVIDGAGYTLQGTGNGTGIDLTGRSNVTIKNTNIKAFDYGIMLHKSSNNTISGNSIANDKYGILLDLSSNNNSLSGNIITNNEYGISLFESSNYNSISGNNITANNRYGIKLYDSSNNTITGNNLTDDYYGIKLEYSCNNTLSGNHITANNYDGIKVYFSSSNTISGNNITASNWHGIGLYYSSNCNHLYRNNITASNWYGIRLYESSDNVLRSNSMINNSHNFGVYGDRLLDFVNDVDVSNTADGKPVYYWINRQDMAVPLNAGYVALVNCSNIAVENLNLKKNGQGIILVSTKGSTITKNKITANCWYGIGLYYSSNHNSVSGNHITASNYDGIRLDHSSNNTISGNNITANNRYGILLEGSSDNTISQNNIANNYDGIMLGSRSSNNSISGNNITNDHYGIGFNFSSNNTITGNSITNNEYGICLSASLSNKVFGNNIAANDLKGIWLEGSSYNKICGNNITNNEQGVDLYMASNNNFYHNNFMFNSIQVFSNQSINTWDDGYPSGGNYWSDYIATANDTYSGPLQNEIGSDGIGDRPYIIDVDNQDRYPLMGPIGFFNACIWDETTYYVHTVSNSAISDFYFSRDDKLVSFNVNGTDGTVGFCRVTIPKELMWCDSLTEWNVTINGNPPTYLKAMEDADYTYLYFTYNHSIQEVQIEGIHVIPELSTWTLMLLILIVLTVAIAI